MDLGREGLVLLTEVNRRRPQPHWVIRRESVDLGSHKVVTGDLAAPYGVAIRGRDAYVSTCSVCPGGGEVWRVSL